MKIPLALLFVLILSSSFAQDVDRKFEVGIGGGTNNSFINYKQYNEQPASPGYQFGVIIKLRLSKKFFFTGQLSYLHQSIKSKNTAMRNDSTSAATAWMEIFNSYSWIAMPIHVNYFLSKSSATNRFFFGLGLSPKRLILSKTKTTYYNGGNNPVSGSFNGGINDWNLSTTAQMGIQFRLKQSNSFIITLSYDRNLFVTEKQYVSPANPVFDYGFIYKNTSTINSFLLNVNYMF